MGTTNLSIGDDGTMDTVVVYDGDLGSFEVRFDSEFRFGFDSDADFLKDISEEMEYEAYVRKGFEGDEASLTDYLIMSCVESRGQIFPTD